MTVAFISYRREDSGPEARLIAQTLSKSLCGTTVFLDTESIGVGDQWPDATRSALDRAGYVIILMGPKWLHAGMDKWGRRRIDNETDWVRQEIAIAIRDKQKTVIPVLVGGAEMPPPDALPDDVAPITQKQAIEIRGSHWDHDIGLLRARIANDTAINHAGAINPLLKPIWPHLDDELRQVFAVAATIAQVESKNYVSTTNFVKALMALKPGRLADFFRSLPDGALPEPVPDKPPLHPQALETLDSFSPCINSAMENLTPEISTGKKLSSEDVYIDIARFAKGKSTQRLRCHGVSKEDVEKIVGQLGWQLVERLSK